MRRTVVVLLVAVLGLGLSGGSAQGSAQPAAPERIVAQGTDGNDPVAQAREMSRYTFSGGDAEFGVLARSSAFPDALGGSALASYVGPLLFVDAAGNLGAETVQEFQRAVPSGGTIYVLGGNSAVPSSVDGQLASAGFSAVRLAGPGREQTARAIADEVLKTVSAKGLPFDTVIVATAGNWPDAVAVGQIAAFWGMPILLTPADQLGQPAAQALGNYRPSTVLVIGGTAAISQAAVAQIEQITGPGTTTRLSGPSRLETSAAITSYNRDVLYPKFDQVFAVEDGEPFFPPELIMVVNLRRGDAFAHVLGASQVVANFGGVFVALDGEDGTVLSDSVLRSICGVNAQVVIAGGTGLVSDTPIPRIQNAAAGQGCPAP